MRALVTGGHGFVGRHLVAHLAGQGDDCTSLDRSGPDPVDVTDADALSARIRAEAPEVVYHLAGWADVGSSWKHPVEAFRVNALGTLNVLLACRDAGVRRCLVVGSADLYGVVSPDELPLRETSPLRPTSPYAASKAAAEDLAVQAHLGYGLETIRVRPFNHLGPGQSEAFVAPALAGRVARAAQGGGSRIPVGDLTARRDFTDVRDVVRCYRLLAERGEPGDVYNVCSGVDRSVEELARELVALSGTHVELEVDPALVRPVDLPVLRGDPA
ncbi:MAG: NAD-dependent epimerase/dehydratase family protein, partial [Acidimicrobiia bacterium]